MLIALLGICSKEELEELEEEEAMDADMVAEQEGDVSGEQQSRKSLKKTIILAELMRSV